MMIHLIDSPDFAAMVARELAKAGEMFDRLLDQGAAAVDVADRLPYYLEAQEIFAREVPFVSLLTKMNVAVMPAELAGYENYLSGELSSLRSARWSDAAPGG